MARADLILKLVKAGAQGDQAQFQKIVEAIAADERAKQHSILADRLLAQLRVSGTGRYNPPLPSSSNSVANSLVSETVPNRRLDDLLLPTDVKEVICGLVEEQHRADLLRSSGLEPRNRVLLTGPPGNGKTSLAEAIADALSVPFILVRYEAVIGSYLGETAQRIGQVCEYAKSHQCVLFFDEFDAVGKERGDLQETGEIKRVVSSLLLQIDALPSYVVVIAASNHPELLDRAAWRRFQIRLELPMPDQHQIEKWFSKFEDRSGQPLGLSHQTLAKRLNGISYAEIEGFGTDVLREIILAQPTVNTRKITEKRLRQWQNRFSVKQSAVPEDKR